MTSSSPDVTGRIARLFLYPIKSCAGIEVQEALLLATGLEWDRAWMVVDEAGDFVTQRTLPRMALIRPQLKTSDMVLRAPGMLALHVALDAVEQPARVRVWDDVVDAWDMGALAAQWFSDFLGQKLRLVRFDPDVQRLSSLKWTGGVEAPVQFNDGFALLVTSDAALDDLNTRLLAAGHGPVGMERFRPNVVLSGVQAHDEDHLDTLHVATEHGPAQFKPVKPCVRCPIPNVDPSSGTPSPEVGDTLQAYRQDPRMNGGITFGMNAIVLAGAGQLLRVGQSVAADYVFD
ncbi:MAG: MOSC N-terminal beta barrel domain-containing protein [Rhodoferax sp.]|nr:MOSC N-terminal beta barrel domain-containing protein [Rhodoferax sp.]